MFAITDSEFRCGKGLGIASPRMQQRPALFNSFPHAMRATSDPADLEGFAHSIAAGGDTSAGGIERSVPEV